MQSNRPPKFSNSKKSEKSASSNIPQESGFVIPGRVKPVEDMSKKCNSCCEKDATRLCVNCNKICCDGCALDAHEDHKIVKLSKVDEDLENEKTKLEKNISEAENSIALKALKSKENEIMEEVDFYFENWFKTLENKKQALKNEIQKILLDLAADSSTNAPNQGIEALKWLSSAKSFSEDAEENKILDNNSLYCSLYQLTKRFKALDISKLSNSCDTAALEKSFDQIQIQHNKQLFEVVKRENIVEIKAKESVKKAPSHIEEVRKISSDTEVSHASHSTQASLNQKNTVASDWGQKDLPKPTPLPKTDICKDLKKAFENKLEIQVKQKDSDSIHLESISKYNSKNVNVNNGLKNNAHVDLFRDILTAKILKESCQKVTDLTLDFFNLTEEGIFSLADAVSQFPSLQTVQLSFYMTLGLYPINLKPLFESLSNLKSLKDLSLKLPTWTHLKGSALLPLLSSVSNILTLQSFSLDLSRCSRLDLKGISEALKYLLRHKNLEKLQISFKGCINIDNDQRALENLYQNCLNSTFKGIKFDFSECPNLSDESLDMIDDINKIKPLY